MDPEFLALIDTLHNSPDASERMQAARALGNYVDDFSDEEYEMAKSALNKAMTDNNPLVLTAAMGSMTKFNRMIGTDDVFLHGDDQDDILPAEKAVCSVCGRPEALIADGGCERADCPYK
ncbi:MAG: HEAT repeat domain-containing protein [Phototrophicaceae bacterium]